jgi:DNA-entry nuclease
MKINRKSIYRLAMLLLVVVGFLLVVLTFWPMDVNAPHIDNEQPVTQAPQEQTVINEPSSYDGIPSVADYDGVHAWVQVNNGEPYFSDEDKSRTDPFELYSELDSLKRCGVAYANVCPELMPNDAREGIGQVKPSGWQTVKYDIVDGGYLYNRCHLIGFQLAGENANPKNLITGTRYLNIKGMLDAENMIADYVKETGNHVLYRVTPIFVGDNLVADGVLMEAYSVEDEGDGICFNIFAFNVQPGVIIDYANGNSRLADENTSTQETGDIHYILNTKSHKFHTPECSAVEKISESNKSDYFGNREELIDQGYEPCGYCHP